MINETEEHGTNLILEMSQLEILCQDVQHPDHLREDENSMPCLLQSHQQLIEQNQLSTALHQKLKQLQTNKSINTQVNTNN